MSLSGEALSTGFLGAARINIPWQREGVSRQLIPIPPLALPKIKVVRSVVRLHVLEYPPNLYAADALLVRSSDGAVLNGAVVDIGLFANEGLLSPIAERDVSLDPNYFAVDFSAGDSLAVLAEAFFDSKHNPIVTLAKMYVCEVDVVFAYAQG